MGKYKKRDKYRTLYDELVKLESSQRDADKAELCEATGYKPGSIAAYIRNKLKNVYIFETTEGRYIPRGVSQISFESFAYFMSQKDHITESSDESLFLNLRNRSTQAFYLAIGTYNNPTLKYRVESFCILLSNAWELLLKARIIETKGEYEIKRADGKTISLLTAVSKVFSDTKNPIRKNIEVMNELRDNSIHLLIPDIQNTLSRIFQASILNYLYCLEDFKYPNQYNNQLPGLLSFVTDLDDLDAAAIMNKYGKNISDTVEMFKKGFIKEEKDLETYRYAIPLNYKVVLTKDEREGDLKLALSKEGVSARLIEVPKNHNKTHPYLQKDIIEIVNERIKLKGITQRLTSYSFQGMTLREHIRSGPDNQFYHRIEKPLNHTYSDQLIEMLIRKIEGDEEYIKKCIMKWSEHLRQK